MTVYESRFYAILRNRGYTGPLNMAEASEWAVEHLGEDLRSATLQAFGAAAESPLRT